MNGLAGMEWWHAFWGEILNTNCVVIPRHYFGTHCGCALNNPWVTQIW